MNNYIITNPTDIFSLIMSVYGTLEESMTLVSDNSVLIPSLNTNVTMMAGQALYYDPALVATYLSAYPVLLTPPTPLTQFSWLGREGQNMFDVCVQTYGILDKQIKLLSDNNVDFTTPVYMQDFMYDSTFIANSSIWNRTTGMGVIFSTGANIVGSFDDSFEFLSFDSSIE